MGCQASISCGVATESKPVGKRHRKLGRFLFQTLLTVLFFAALALGYYFLLRDPSLVNEEFPVTMPESRVVGVLGEDVVNGPVAFRVDSVRRIPSEDLEPNARLGSRAEPSPTTDYLILRVALTNRRGEALPSAYSGNAQRVDLLVGSRKPSPDVDIPAYPREAEIITGERALPSEVPPNETIEGVLVFPINQASEELSLLILPSSRFRDEASAFPSFEITLDN